MNVNFKSARYGLTAILVMLVKAASAQGNSAFQPSQEQLIARVDPQLVMQLKAPSDTLQRDPNNVTALVRRGAVALQIADQSMYSYFWVHYAALNLEKALRLEPNNYYARHNYAMACFQSGDFSDAQPNMHLAVTQFSKAIQIKPDAARSYMGRGYAYLEMDNVASATADFDRALQIDPKLHDELVRYAATIAQKRAQKPAVLAMIKRLGSYFVNQMARTAEACQAAMGYWTNNECRISTAMAPGPLYPGGPNPPSASVPPSTDAPNARYNPKAAKGSGGVFVR